MSEKKVKKDSRKIVGLVLLALFFSTVATGAWFYNVSEQRKNQIKTLVEGSSEVQALKDAEIKELKKQFENIKDSDDVLKRDIHLYIKTTHPKVPTIVAKEIAEHAVVLGRKHKVSPELIIGIIKVESAFNPMAVGPKTKYGHARGLMQVMPEWAPKLGLKNQYDFHEIDVAIDSGIKVFKIHLEEGKGDISTGLYYYVNRDKSYVANVYAAMGKFVAFRSTINEEELNVETDIDRNGDSKKLPEDKQEPENKQENAE
jgi:hypothetical protein